MFLGSHVLREYCQLLDLVTGLRGLIEFYLDAIRLSPARQGRTSRIHDIYTDGLLDACTKLYHHSSTPLHQEIAMLLTCTFHNDTAYTSSSLK